MYEPFRAYVNKAGFATNGEEIQIALYIERPVFDDDGKLIMVREEQGLLTMSTNYAKSFAKKILDVLEGHENKIREVIKNEPK